MRVNQLHKRNLEFIIVTNDTGLEVILANLGASIYSIKYDNDMMSMTPIMSLDFEKSTAYYGKTVGRVAGRIKNSEINYDNKIYKLEANEGTTSLHGGPHGLFTKYWSSSVKELSYGIEVTYTYLSLDNEGGYPGNANFLVTYLIHKDEAVIDIKFECDVDKTCPINITNHTYFCLGEKSLKECELMIHADKFIEVDPINQIPLKEKEVFGPLDFNNYRNLLKDINDPYLQDSKTKGYDHFFIFNCDANQISLKGSRYQMDIDTSFEGVQIYTHNYMDNIITMASGALQYRGVALEPQLNQLHQNLLKPGETYRHYISYSFKRI